MPEIQAKLDIDTSEKTTVVHQTCLKSNEFNTQREMQKKL